MNINFGNIEFGGGVIGIYGKRFSGRTAIRQSITESIVENKGRTFTNRFIPLEQRRLTEESKIFHIFDGDDYHITYDDIFYIKNHCIRYDQQAFVFGIARHLRPEQTYQYHLFRSPNEMRTYDQVHIIQDMKLTTLKNRYGTDDYQVFDFVKRGSVALGCGEQVFARPCEELIKPRQLTISHETVCPECRGAKQILMLDNFVPCKLCE